MMRAVVQRVSEASVSVDGQVIGAIGRGLLVLLGVTHSDGPAEAASLARKIAGLRIFEDTAGKFNLALADVGGALLVVSQFTLYGSTARGRRPSWVAAAGPDHAEPLIDQVVAELQASGATVATGRFRADMAVELVNDGPVTLLLEVGRTPV